MIYLITMLITTPLLVSQMRLVRNLRQGIVPTIIDFVVAFLIACGFILLGVILPPVRSIFLQIGAGIITVTLAAVAYFIFKNMTECW